jgi:hypothetical protein
MALAFFFIGVNISNKGEKMKSIFMICFLLVGVSVANAGTESFRQSCNVRSESRDRVQADCLDMRGRYHHNDAAKGCRGDLANIDGQISCVTDSSGRPGRGDTPQLPAGSYLQTCNGCYADQSTLSCRCEDTHGSFHSTSLNYQYCRGDIANIDGNLSCH